MEDNYNYDKDKRKKRERKKCKRRKIHLDDRDMILINGNDSVWDVPNISSFVHQSKSTAGSNINKIDKLLTLESMVGSKFIQLFIKIDARILTKISEKVQKLSKNFEKIRFRRILNDHVPKYSHQKMAYLISHPLNKKQLNAYTEKIFALLFKDDFINPQNTHCFQANIVNAFADLRNRGPIMLREEVSKGIVYNRIQWIDGIPFKLQRALTRNMLKSILNLYIRIFSSHFYSTLNYAGKIVHYRRDIWHRITLESFDILKAERKLVLLDTVNVNLQTLPYHKIRFFPKQKNTRPIMLLSNPLVKQLLTEVRAVLHYVMSKNTQYFGWGISNIRLFQFAYRRFLQQHFSDNKNKQVYFCSTDLENCFTSLEHPFLEKLLQKSINLQSTYYVITAHITNSILNYKTIRSVAGATYAEAITRLEFKPNEQLKVNKVVQISGVEIIERLRQYTMQTIVKVPSVISKSPTLYQCNRGIAQGNQLSVILCNLYLGAMERIIFPNRPQNILCQRYVDDYIMISYAREQIEQVMERLLASASEYGLNFGKIFASFRANFLNENRQKARVLKPSEKISWCGLSINTKSLSMTEDYTRYLKRPATFICPTNLHQSECFSWITGTMKKILKGRMLALRDFNRIWPTKRRRIFKRHFCNFAYSHYLKYFIGKFNLNLRDRRIRCFIEQFMRLMFRCFKEKHIKEMIL